MLVGRVLLEHGSDMAGGQVILILGKPLSE